MLIGMHEKDRRSSVRRSDDSPRKPRIDTTTVDRARHAVTLWRMRSATFDNQASCSVTDVGKGGCVVLVIFTKGLGVPEHFDDVGAAVRHSMEIAGRLTAQGWVDIELSDR
jgi:hypothetical protein